MCCPTPAFWMVMACLVFWVIVIKLVVELT